MSNESTDSELERDRAARDHFLKALPSPRESEPDILLVVDDLPEVRQLVIHDIRRFVSRVEIFEAGNGHEALAQVKRIRLRLGRDPTLIILDLQMPELDGFGVIEALEKEYRAAGRDQGIPIIVLSSTTGEKGHFLRRSVHGSRATYVPLVSVAKEDCVAPARYDAAGTEGLLAWVRHFLHRDRR